MVSFQCNGCGDVIKKPKLDAHYARCHAPFDCIDCSTTFHTPTEFKGHTSCITEAEKYQKNLYKGPKGKQNQCQGGVENNGKGRSNDAKGTDGQGGGESNGQSKTTALTPEPPKFTSGPTEVPTKPKKDKKPKEKKARSDDIADEMATIADPSSVPLPLSPEKPSDPTPRQSKDKDKKKSKKQKEKELEDGDTNGEKSKVETDENKGGEKVKGRKKTRKDATSIVAEAEQDSIRAPVEDFAMDVDRPSVYKEKDTQGAIADLASVPHPPSPEKPSGRTSLRSKEKDKKREKEKDPKDDGTKGDKSKVDAEKKMKEGKTEKKAKKVATSVVVEDRVHAEGPVMDVDQTNVQCAEVSEGKKKKKVRKNIASIIEVSGENGSQTRVDDPATAVDQLNVHDAGGSEEKKKKKHKNIPAGKKVDQQGEETKSKKRKRTEVESAGGTKKSKQ